MELKKSLNFSFFGLKERSELEDSVIEVLNSINKTALSHYINYILSEAATNAAKANLKKAYMEDKKININDDLEYQKALEEFKKVLDKEPQKLEDTSRIKGFFIKIEIYLDGDKLVFFVINNSPLLEKEKKRILEKYVAARKF